MVCRLENGGRNIVCLHAVVLLCISWVSQCLSWRIEAVLLLYVRPFAQPHVDCRGAIRGTTSRNQDM
jgi:hypothetical protein